MCEGLKVVIVASLVFLFPLILPTSNPDTSIINSYKHTINEGSNDYGGTTTIHEEDLALWYKQHPNRKVINSRKQTSYYIILTWVRVDPKNNVGDNDGSMIGDTDTTSN